MNGTALNIVYNKPLNLTHFGVILNSVQQKVTNMVLDQLSVMRVNDHQDYLMMMTFYG